LSVVDGIDVEDEPSPQNSKGRGVLGHAVCYGIGAISVQLVSVALLPLYTRYMTLGEYGVLSILYKVGFVLNMCLMTGGIQMAALNFWGKANSEDERKRVAATIGLVSAAGLILATLFVLVGSRPLANFLDLKQPNLLAFGITAMMLQGTTYMPLALMQARMQSLSYLISTVSIAVCQLVLVLLALVYFGAGVWGVVVAMGITYALFGVILNVREFRRSSLVPDLSMLKSVLKFSLPFIPGGVLYFMLQNGDQFFLQKYHGETTVGIYALAYKIAESVTMVASQPLMQIWNAKIYEVHKQPDAPLQFGRAYSRILFAFFFVGVLAVLFKGEAMVIVGKNFGASAVFIAPLILAHAFQVFGSLMDGAIYVTRRTDLKPWIFGASAIVITIAYYLMIPRWAEFGAVYATLLGYMFFCGLNAFVAQRVFRVQIEYIRIVVVLAIAIAMCAVELLFPMHFVLKAALVLLVLASVWGGGLFHEEEKRWAQDTMKKSISLVTRCSANAFSVLR